MMPADHWLDKIERLRPGDKCEVQCNADAKWYLAEVMQNGLSWYWVVKLLGKTYEGAKWTRYIEQIRLPGQEEAWDGRGEGSAGE